VRLLKIPAKQGIIAESEDDEVLIELDRRRNARGYFISGRGWLLGSGVPELAWLRQPGKDKKGSNKKHQGSYKLLHPRT